LGLQNTLQIQAANDKQSTLLLQKNQQNDFSSMQHIPVSEEVKVIIKSLKSKNLCGYDGISPKLLKIFGALIS
jgi:hypothetical protein